MKIFTMSFLVFVLMSCASIPSYTPQGKYVYHAFNFENAKISSNLKTDISNLNFRNACSEEIKSGLGENYWGETLFNINDWNSLKDKAEIIDNYEDAYYEDMLTDGQGVVAIRAINLITKEEVFISNMKIANSKDLKTRASLQVDCATALITNLCSSITGSSCFIANANENNSGMRRIEEYWAQKTKESIKEEQIKVSNFLRLEDVCKGLGFTGDENIELCIKREAQYELELNQAKNLNDQRSANQNDETRNCFICDILLAVIEEYPAAKVQADREAAIRRRALIEGHNRARAQCQLSKNC